MNLTNQFLKDLFSTHPGENESERRALLRNLLLVEEFLSDRFIALTRLILAGLLVAGYFFLSPGPAALRPNFTWFLVGVLVYYTVLVILSNFERFFSRRFILLTVIVDGLLILALFSLVAGQFGYQVAAGAESLIFLQTVYLVLQVARMSRGFLVVAGLVLLLGRGGIFLWFHYLAPEPVLFPGLNAGLFPRLLGLLTLFTLLYFTANRTRKIGYRSIDEYLLKNNLAMQNRQLLKLAIVDDLTGLYIARYFHYALDRELQRSERHNQPLALLLMDLDHFKKVNDTLGHQVGDQVLREVGRLIRGHCRPYDVSARYGGDEMALILPATDTREARLVGERLRENIDCAFADREDRVTLSVGIAVYRPHGVPDPKKLLASADRAMYKAKDAGRNRVCLA